MQQYEREPGTLPHKAEHGLDAGVREAEGIVAPRGSAVAAPEAAHTGPLVGEAVEDVAETGRAMGAEAAPYEQDEFREQ